LFFSNSFLLILYICFSLVVQPTGDGLSTPLSKESRRVSRGQVHPSFTQFQKKQNVRKQFQFFIFNFEKISYIKCNKQI